MSRLRAVCPPGPIVSTHSSSHASAHLVSASSVVSGGDSSVETPALDGVAVALVVGDATKTMTNDDALPRGASIARFVVLGLLGRGGMGEVYAAYDPELDRNVAIKLVRVGRGTDSADGRVRLMREAQAIARVSHPNVVVVFDAGTFQDRVFIAMELVQGHTLRYWMHARARTWPEVLEVFTAAGRGLAAAHERELVHRDFKPDNVMIGADGQVRVMDFGLVQLATGREKRSTPATDTGVAVATHTGGGPTGQAIACEIAERPAVLAAAIEEEDIMSTRAVGAAAPTLTIASVLPVAAMSVEITQAGASLGTPAYMSPEQFRGEPTDARTDQFSFCIALYETLYGDRPFVGRSYQELVDKVVNGRMRDIPDESPVPAWIRDILLRGLRVDPGERWPSMNALLAELEKQPAVASRRRFATAAAARLAGIWDVPRGNHAVETSAKAEIRQAFLSTGKVYAAKACESASQILDRYARRWSDLYVEACEATHVRGEQSAEVLDLRMVCLQEGLEDLKALCRVFRQATPEVVENAVNAANALGGLDRCENVELLRAIVRPPQDPETRDAVSGLRTQLADVRALVRVGRLNDALAASGPVEQGVRGIKYGPLLADFLTMMGSLHIERGAIEEAAVALEEALWTAVPCRHDEAAAEAATQLVYCVGCVQLRFEAAEIWSRMAEVLLQRIGGHDLLWGWLLHNRAGLRESQGRLTDALADARKAAIAKEKALGPDHPDLGYSIGNIALYLDGLGELAEAVEHGRRALQIVQGGLGPDHPRTAVVLSNYSEFLVRIGLFDEAAATAARALSIFERETDRDSLYVTYPLVALGAAQLGAGRVQDALPIYERAHRIRDAKESAAAKRAEAQFGLARALWDAGGDRTRARTLSVAARDAYQQAPATPATQRELAAVEVWLTAHPDGA
jgi:serine/threonine protein kinase/tetratricopeptide (TPR) repeat protein